MAINFPNSPTDGQIFYDPTSGNRYIYSTTKGRWSVASNNSPFVATADKQVLFNNQNSIDGDAGLVFDSTANTLTANTINAYSMRVTGNLYVGSNTVTISNNSIAAQELYVLDSGGNRVLVASGNTDVSSPVKSSYVTANAAFAHSNSVMDKTNTSFAVANSGFGLVNTAFGVANAAFGQSNGEVTRLSAAYVVANGAYTYTNSAYTVANAGFGIANSAVVNAAAAYAAVNTLATSANAYAASVGTSTNNYTSATYSTLTQFGSVFGVANGAFGKANTALQNTTGNFSGSLGLTGSLGVGTTSISSELTVDGVLPKLEMRSGGYLMMRPVGNTWDMRLQANSATLNIFSGGDLTNPIATFVHGGTVGIGTQSPVNKLHVVSSTQPDDANGLVKAESTYAANAVNASLTTKNWSGTSQMMQWENFGLRFGSRIKTNYGAGNIYFTVGNDAVAATLDTSSYLNVYGGIATPIVYDRDNTSYYLNPAGTSIFGDTLTISTVTDQTLTLNSTDSGWNYIGFSWAGTRKSYFGVSSSGNPTWGSDSGLSFSIEGSYTTIQQSTRSPIFYDSDNTGYYCDPNSTSNFNAITQSSFPAGHVLQVVSTTKTSTFTNGSSQTWADITGMSATITPTSSSSKILIIFNGQCSFNTGGSNYGSGTKLLRGTTDIYVGDARGSGTRCAAMTLVNSGSYSSTHSWSYLDSPATTSATTYKVQLWGEAAGAIIGGSYNTGSVWNSNTPITLTLMEIRA